MFDYDELHSYDEVREDFLKTFRQRLQNSKGSELKLIGGGTPFESMILKREGKLICPRILMEMVYINCYILALMNIDEAISDILNMIEKGKWIPQEQVEQLDNVFIYPMNLITYRDKLDESNIAYLPFQDMAVTFQFYLNTGNERYCSDVTKEHLMRWGISAEELFEKVRYKEFVEIDGNIEKVGDSSVEMQQVFMLSGLNGFGAVFYPKVIEQVTSIIGSEILIIPDDAYTTYIQSPNIISAAKLYEELDINNKAKISCGDERHAVSGYIFRYDAEKKKLFPVKEEKIEKCRSR